MPTSLVIQWTLLDPHYKDLHELWKAEFGNNRVRVLLESDTKEDRLKSEWQAYAEDKILRLVAENNLPTNGEDLLVKTGDVRTFLEHN